MPTIPFRDMPDSGRLWVFAAQRDLEPAEEGRLLEEVDSFLEGWKAHGQPLVSAREWREGRFLFVAVDPASEPPSGCSIDAMVRRLGALEEDLGVTLTDHAPVHWREGEEVRTASRPAFKRLAGEGRVTPSTRVFDTTLTSVEGLRAGRFEVPARDAWHGKAFFREAAAGT